jgi:serine/threonine protein kinase
VEGLTYLHSEKVRHRDIKPQNVLVKGDRVYLTDFGVCLDWMNLSRSTTTEDSAKTWIYCAPEVAAYQPRNSSSDVWSLGCIFLEMLTILKGLRLDDIRKHLKNNGNDYWYWKNPKAIDTRCQKLSTVGLDWDNTPLEWIALMLKLAPAERPTASSLGGAIKEFRVSYPTSPVSFSSECCEVAQDLIYGTNSSWDAWELQPTILDDSGTIKGKEREPGNSVREVCGRSRQSSSDGDDSDGDNSDSPFYDRRTREIGIMRWKPARPLKQSPYRERRQSHSRCRPKYPPGEVSANESAGPEDDILFAVYRGKTYYCTFPAYSINEKKLTVGELKQKLGMNVLHIPGRIRRYSELLYNGQSLRDGRACSDYGLKNHSELLFRFTEPIRVI